MAKPEAAESPARPGLARRVRRIAWSVFSTALLVWVVCGAALYLGQDGLIFPATSDVFRDPGSEGWPFQNVTLAVGGESTQAWYLPMADAPGTVLFSHGNAGNLANRIEAIRRFRELGLSVFVYDYGGYGESTGRPSEARCYADARAAWDWLVGEAATPPETIIIAGRSLGGAVAAHLAAEVDAGPVILESTFTSLPAMAWNQYPIYPVSRLLRHRFDTMSIVGDIAEPKLIVHSPNDHTVPFAMGEALFEAATPPKAFLEIVGDHNRGFMIAGAGYTQGLRTFLSGYLAGMNKSQAAE